MHTNVMATMQFAGTVIDICSPPRNDYAASDCNVLRAHTLQLRDNRSQSGERLCHDPRSAWFVGLRAPAWRHQAVGVSGHASRIPGQIVQAAAISDQIA